LFGSQQSDDKRLHGVKWNGKHAHPPCSPDLAPSDFFLFPLVKKRFDRFEFDDHDGLIEAITEILATLQADRLQRVFQRCIDTVQIAAQGWRLHT
jgi:hypothetical protein